MELSSGDCDQKIQTRRPSNLQQAQISIIAEGTGELGRLLWKLLKNSAITSKVDSVLCQLPKWSQLVQNYQLQHSLLCIKALGKCLNFLQRPNNFVLNSEYCITNHIYCCTFFRGVTWRGKSLKWSIYISCFKASSLGRKRNSIYELLFLDVFDGNLSLKEKGETYFEGRTDFLLFFFRLLERLLLWQCDGFHAGKCPLIPGKIKHSGLCHRFSSVCMCACAPQSCTSEWHPQVGNSRTNSFSLCFFGGKDETQRTGGLHSPDVSSSNTVCLKVKLFSVYLKVHHGHWCSL